MQREHESSEGLAAYALGAVDPAEVNALRAHLHCCAICTDELIAFEPVVRWLTAFGEKRQWRVFDHVVDLGVRLQQIWRNYRGLSESFLIHIVTIFFGAIEVWIALKFMNHPVGVIEAVAIESLGQGGRSAAFFAPMRTTFLFLVGMGKSNVPFPYAFQSRSWIERRNMISPPVPLRILHQKQNRAIDQNDPKVLADAFACRFPRSPVGSRVRH